LVDIFIVEANQTLTADYCVSSMSDNYTYLIPLNARLPLTALTIQFLPANSAVVFYMCTEQYTDCVSENNLTNVTVASQVNSTQFSLPVGFYSTSVYTFRMPFTETSVVCSLPSTQLSVDFAEFSLTFKRMCTDT
jgi:hypothetical protein